jgi:putative serine protease PepD
MTDEIRPEPPERPPWNPWEPPAESPATAENPTTEIPQTPMFPAPSPPAPGERQSPVESQPSPHLPAIPPPVGSYGGGYGAGYGAPYGAQPLAASAGARERKAPRTGVLLGLGVVIALLAGCVGGGVVYGLDRVAKNRGTNSGITLGAVQGGDSSRPPTSTAGIAQRVERSVVKIAIRTSQGGGNGSGFVVNSDGYIVTNNHVVAPIAGGGSLQVQFSDGSAVPAKVVGTDASYDLAVIKVEKSGLQALSFGNSDQAAVGDPVIAIGSPLGFAGTVTSGIVSAKNRAVTAGETRDERSFISALQTDAAINPGNSGGPLVDAKGQVIGVNSSIATPGSAGQSGQQSGNIGIGFAIPSNVVRRVAEQIISKGKASHPVIGVLLDFRYNGEGARIAAAASGGNPPITVGGPAEKAGLRAGDVITKVDGMPIGTPDELIAAIRAKEPGQSVDLIYVRSGASKSAQLVLSSSTSS